MLRMLIRLLTCAALACLCACDKLRGPESREIAGGYRLKRVGNANEFALIIPHGSGGLIVDEIGWREPVIIARGGGSYYWEVINTAHAERKQVSSETLKSDPVYQKIEAIPADRAWASLKPDSRVW
jgi:hypothetical protein